MKPEFHRGVRALQRSDRGDRAGRHARTAGRRPDAAHLEQPDDAGALAAIRLEQLEHPGVGRAALAGERERNDVRQVEVADADGVGVAERAERDLRRGPRPDPGQRRQPPVGVGAAAGRRSPRTARRAVGDRPDEVRSATLEPERVERVVREPPRGPRAAAAAAARTARAPARPSGRMMPRRPRQASTPVTFCSRIAGTSASRTAPVRPIRSPGRRRSSSAEQIGRPGRIRSGRPSSPTSAGAPARTRSAPGPQASASSESRRAATARSWPARPGVRVARIASPGPEPHRRVAGARGGSAERPPEVERTVERDRPERASHPSLSRRLRDSPRRRRIRPHDRSFPATVPETCDAPESSRAWRSSAVLAAVAVPGSAGSRGLSPETVNDATPLPWCGGCIGAWDKDDDSCPRPGIPFRRCAGYDLGPARSGSRSAPAGRPTGSPSQPAAQAAWSSCPTWHFDDNVQLVRPRLLRQADRLRLCDDRGRSCGVAHRTLPCGTKVTFKNPDNGRTITVPVVDRGPYVSGRDWDLTGGAVHRTGPLLHRLDLLEAGLGSDRRDEPAVRGRAELQPKRGHALRQRREPEESTERSGGNPGRDAPHEDHASRVSASHLDRRREHAREVGAVQLRRGRFSPFSVTTPLR